MSIKLTLSLLQVTQSHFRLASWRQLVTLEVTQRHSKRHEANRNDSHENAYDQFHHNPSHTSGSGSKSS